MDDSQLNKAEHGLQRSFMKLWIFNGLPMACAVLGAWLPIRDLPNRPALPDRSIAVRFTQVALQPAEGALRVAGAWKIEARDPRFGGFSALGRDGDQFVALSDLGAAVRFDPPWSREPKAFVRDLVPGPGPLGRKSARDAESLARDPAGRGWWVGYEQRHSLWLYDREFRRAKARIELRQHWRRNRGAEGLVANSRGLVAFRESGEGLVQVGRTGVIALPLSAGAEVSDASIAPDGSIWLLLRSKELTGIAQSIAPLLHDRHGHRIGRALRLPRGRFDNLEGMTIERRGGGWRFWLISDDGHRVLARTLLVALDLDIAAGNEKGPAQRTGP